MTLFIVIGLLLYLGLGNAALNFAINIDCYSSTAAEIISNLDHVEEPLPAGSK